MSGDSDERTTRKHTNEEAGKIGQATATDTLVHFLNRCENTQVHFRLTYPLVRSQNLFDLALAILPKSHHFSVKGQCRPEMHTVNYTSQK